MDARDYLARKGIGVERDPERPNTLEEKAWARARESGEHRPRAGTPHDWEDWEQFHAELAEGAEAIEQKIDHEVHRRAPEHAAAERWSPPPRETAAPESSHAGVASPAIAPGGAGGAQGALLALAVLLPPLAVGLSRGGARRVGISLLLTLLGWVPGVVHALLWMRRN